MPFHPYSFAPLVAGWIFGYYNFFKKLIPKGWFILTSVFNKYPKLGIVLYAYSMMVLTQYMNYVGGGLLTLIEIFLISLGFAGAKFGMQTASTLFKSNFSPPQSISQ